MQVSVQSPSWLHQKVSFSTLLATQSARCEVCMQGVPYGVGGGVAAPGFFWLVREGTLLPCSRWPFSSSSRDSLPILQVTGEVNMALPVSYPR